MTDAQQDPTGTDPAQEQDRHFGEQGARLTYGSYLRVAQLLDQQRLESDPPAHDELLFITVHQVYELWFKQLLHELTAARDEMFSGDLWRARHLLGRVVAIEDVLIRQIAVLETMTPQDFLVFRDRLAPDRSSPLQRESGFRHGCQLPACSCHGTSCENLRAGSDGYLHPLRHRSAPTLPSGKARSDRKRH